ncbi:TonB-dependent receptor [Cellvibrio japonicus]|uniref:Ferrisiderophore receptor-like protein n=1 Tax=Cellvibrio japonicus (strain Ueda107) TaxID=498211 RepID=B3PJV0_CELJU|nr:TonB-dependent siderophore receptor [Cellvibrio japonicus]ACE83000.1 ferrisiderophore receptor-like protein [Cellvibrio japonicus Ueda107]QEI12732.1 TonB-dependent siderophore receptor [Cellvibrio japonicus]QEI16306.1 TonB-dependent siderophore receptor [Cellvibrio japonicus]QEI19884.1 TonB-dependent siderophore receptor [Cellvibrio japonicus]
MTTSTPVCTTRIKPLALAILTIATQGLIISPWAQAAQSADDGTGNKAVMPTVVVEAMSEQDPSKSYINYKQASVTRNGLDVKDTPQTIDTIDVQKYKLYGVNDLSVMLTGTPGVNTQYDMRGDGIMIRGFSADSSDIYRDGIRESGQVRRSTSNVERIEILKGPASLLYGRSAGGGVVNMVSKYANFESFSNAGLYLGSWGNRGFTLDINQVNSENLAVRVTAEAGDSESFRDGISNEINMVSPSFTYNNRAGLEWTVQYTYDKLTRVPDRGPAYDSLPSGTSIRTGFAQEGDYVEDILNSVRSDVRYQLTDNWNLHWVIAHREAEQNFDHFFAGTWCNDLGKTLAGANCTWNGYVRQNYAWQETINKTNSHIIELSGQFNTGSLEHRLLVGIDSAWEVREPELFSNSGSNSIYGYINPFNNEDRYNELATKGHPAASQHNFHQAEAHAAFIQDVITPVPDVKLIVGARYDWYEFESTNRLLAPGAANRQRGYSDGNVSPSVGLTWQPVPAHSLYVSYNESFAPYGGRGMLSVSPSSTAVYDDEPQFQNQYELGIKSDWLDGRLNTQFALFSIEKNNIRYRPDPDNDPFTWAVQGEQRSRGAEFSFIGRVIDTVYVRGGFGWLDATVEEDVVSPLLVGNYLANTSKESGNLFIRYVPSDRWYGEVGVTHAGDQWTNIANTSKLDGYQRIDAALGYSLNNINITLALSNLTDEEYWRSSSMPGSPRSLLLRANYQF